jgi:hypothetical protein
MESEVLNFLLIEKSNCRTHEIGKGSLDACKENFEGLGCRIYSQNWKRGASVQLRA